MSSFKEKKHVLLAIHIVVRVWNSPRDCSVYVKSSIALFTTRTITRDRAKTRLSRNSVRFVLISGAARAEKRMMPTRLQTFLLSVFNIISNRWLPGTSDDAATRVRRRPTTARAFTSWCYHGSSRTPVFLIPQTVCAFCFNTIAPRARSFQQRYCRFVSKSPFLLITKQFGFVTKEKDAKSWL